MPPKEYYLPRHNLVEQQNASIIQRANIPRSVFRGKKTRITAFSAGYLVPFHVEEVLPGDHFKYLVHPYVRLQTPLFPIFSNQNLETFWFFCPARLVWDNFVKMMGEQAAPGDSIAYTVPTVNLGVADLLPNTIYDHMGLPVNMAAGASIDPNALPFRIYNFIWNTWFRDQNINSPTTVRKTDTGDVPADYVLKRRNKQHDYFTACLPFAQKFTTPYMPLTGFANVLGIGTMGNATGPAAANWLESSGLSPVYANAFSAAQAVVTTNDFALQTDGVTNIPMVRADMSTATGVAVNALRNAFMVQTLLERDARGGTRYTELIRSHFGVINPDFRLQRPEYIGGGSTPLIVTPVAQTAPTAGATVGALGGAATAAGRHTASYAATEHGYIIALINVQTELGYQQGLHRMWSRSTRYDFYWPALAQLGEQAVLQQEIFCTGDGSADGTVFGYQARHEEYRQMYSDVTGYMRTDFVGNLDEWHLVEHYTAAPTLSATFLRSDPPVDRVLAAGATADEMQYLADILIERVAVRPIPTFGTPATLGRF